MREEIQSWWKLALEDLDAAQATLSIEKHYVCAFLSQQAAEKSLKAVVMATQRKASPRTHSLLELAKALAVLAELQSAARRLNSAYVTSRYPDAANGGPLALASAFA